MSIDELASDKSASDKSRSGEHVKSSSEHGASPVPRGPSGRSRTSSVLAATCCGLIAALASLVPGPRLQTADEISSPVRARIVGEGRPIAGAQVVGAEGSTVTGRDGTFDELRFPLRVSATGWATADFESPAPELELERPVAASGSIVNMEGDPVVASVEAWVVEHDHDWDGDATERSPAPIDTIETGQDGLFVFETLGPGVLRLRVSAPGYATQTLFSMGRSAIRVVLAPAATIAGVVHDSAGFTRGGAEIIVAGSGIWPPRSQRSDSDGTFVISDVPPGVYEVWARDGMQRSPAEAGIELRAGDVEYRTLRMIEGESVVGRVLTPDGEAIPDVDVLLSDGAQALAPIRTSTDGTGTFSLEALLPVPFARTLLFSHPGYLAQERSLPSGESSITVVMTRGATVRGRVLDADGNPVANATVQWSELGVSGSLIAPDGEFAALTSGDNLGVTVGPVPPIPFAGEAVPMLVSTSVRTDENGYFELQGITPGQGSLQAIFPGRAPSEAVELALEEGQEFDELDLSLVEGGTLDVRVVDAAGYPHAFAAVEVTPWRDGVAIASQRRVLVTSDTGELRIEGALFDIELIARPVGASPARTLVSGVVAGEVRRVTLRTEGAGFALSGRVTDAHGFGVADVELVVSSGRDETSFEVRALSERDGTYSLSGLPAPPYRLLVAHPGHVTMIQSVAGEGPRLSADVTLVEGRRIRGVVTFSNGRGAAGAEVRLTSDSTSRTSVTNTAGSFEFGDVAAGAYELSAELEGRRGSAGVVLRDMSAEVALVLSSAGRLQVRVRDSLGDPAPGTQVLLDGQVVATTRSSGRATIGGVPPGYHQVWGEHEHAGSARPQRVRIQEDQVSELEFVLPRRIPLGVEIDVEEEPSDESHSASGEGGSTRLGAIRRGVAIQLRRDGERVVVSQVIDGTHAARSGIRAGDVLVSVDGEAVLSAGTGRAMLSGDEGRARLELRRGTRRFFRTVDREEFRD